MAGGTGNLILKRGTAIPDGSPASLLKAMPAVQLIGLSPISNDGSVFNTGDTKAFANYPNRLWVGMDALGGTSQAEGSSGTGGTSGGVVPALPPGSGGAISSQLATRPIWMGAEIRANVAVFHPDDTGTSAVPTVLEADWTNPSDYVLVTQKSIQSYVSSQVSGKGTMSSFNLAADTGTPATITNAGTITIAGGTSNGIDTSISGSTVTVALDISELGDLAKPGLTANMVTYDSNNGHMKTTVGGVISNIGATGSVVSVTSSGVSSFGTFDSSVLATALNDEVGSGKVVFNTSPTLVTSLSTSSTSFELLNSIATTINFGGGASTAVNIGNASGIVDVAGNLRVTGNVIQMNTGTTALSFSGTGNVAVAGDLAVNGATSADITTTTTQASLFDSTATTVNIAGGATTALNLGFDGTGGSTTNISVGEMTNGGHVKTINIGTTTSTTTNGFVSINIGSANAASSQTIVNGNLNVTGNLTIDGTTTTVNTTTLIVEDKNIELGNVATPANNTANGGGITLLGGDDGDKTLLWNNTNISGFGTGYWQSSENFSVAGTKAYLVGTDPVLTKTYLRVYNSGTGGGSITIKSPNSSNDILTNSYTLPTTLGSANQVLTVSSVTGGNDAILSWVDPSTLSSGTASAVTVRREITGSTTKYPIPFLASNAQDNPTLNQSGNDFTSWTETATRNGYLYTDYTSQSINGGPTNKVAGLMYEVSDSGSSTVGTLYCDYIGATLDCGEY